MGDMKDLIVEVVSSDPVARKIARAQKLDKRLGELAEGAVVDDNVAPAAPTGASVGLGVRSVVVTWAPPDPGDFVAYTVVTLEAPPGTPVVTKSVSGSGVTITGLTAGTAYTAKLKHVDRWAHESTVTTVAGTHTPTSTVADQIDLDAAVIAGSLGWTSIDMITDPNVMGDDVIVARAMAVQDAAALNLWVGTAAIESAKIKEITADKIKAGTISTTTITVDTELKLGPLGKLTLYDVSSALQFSIDALGMSLKSSASMLSQPRTGRSAKITDTSALPFTSYGVFETPGTPTWRGAHIKAAGAELDANIGGRLRLNALSNDAPGTDTMTDATGSKFTVGSIIDLMDVGSAGGDMRLVSDNVVLTARNPAHGVKVYGGVWAADNATNWFEGSTTFAKVPASLEDPASGSHLVRRSYLESKTVTTPSVTANWSVVAGSPLVVTKFANGWVSVEGRIKNTSGSSNVAGTNIWVNVIANRPANPRTFCCPRTDNAGAWVIDLSAQIGVNANGDVLTRVAFPAGAEVGVSFGYQSA